MINETKQSETFRLELLCACECFLYFGKIKSSLSWLKFLWSSTDATSFPMKPHVIDYRRCSDLAR